MRVTSRSTISSRSCEGASAALRRPSWTSAFTPVSGFLSSWATLVPICSSVWARVSASEASSSRVRASSLRRERRMASAGAISAPTPRMLTTTRKAYSGPGSSGPLQPRGRSARAPVARAVAPSNSLVWARSPARQTAAAYAAISVTSSGLRAPPVTKTASAVVTKRLACDRRIHHATASGPVLMQRFGSYLGEPGAALNR